MSEQLKPQFVDWWEETGQHLPLNPLDTAQDAWDAAMECTLPDLTTLRAERDRLKVLVTRFVSADYELEESKRAAAIRLVVNDAENFLNPPAP